MKLKVTLAALVAACGAYVADACHIYVTVSCPGNGNSAAGISVCATSMSIPGQTPTCGVTDNTGFVDLFTPGPDDYMVCVDTTTLPGNANLANPCQSITCVDPGVSLTFDLTGDLCTPPPPPGSPCWETGGGTLDKVKGDNVWTFGGVIYPGCSSHAGSGGGNLNIVNHVTGLHFKGEEFHVVDCRGVSTKSPKVTVNIIDWTGSGEVTLAGATIPVTFTGTFMDAKDGGAGNDGLYIQVLDSSHNLVFQIGSSSDISGLDILTTGNVQIHQSSCGKGKP